MDHQIPLTPHSRALLEHRDELLEVAGECGLTNVRVFGSMAGGQADDNSDVDILAAIVPGTKAGFRLFGFAGRAQADRALLDHIGECIQDVRKYTTSGSGSLDDKWNRRATVRTLQILAESTQRLSPEIEDSEPTIPCRDIADFRNAMVHAYLNIDREAVWTRYRKPRPNVG